MKMHLLRRLVHVALVMFATVATTPAMARNILLLVADDYGTDACSLYTSDPLVPPTPNLDALAQVGVTFDNAWTNPACSPTRATMITGKYGFRTGVSWVVGRFTPPGELDVTDPKLLPKRLKSKGYSTALIGKWHLTSNPAAFVPGPADFDPNLAGFDYWAGFVEGALAFLGPPGRGYFHWAQVIQGVRADTTAFATTENVDQARDFIESQAGPWFVSLNFAAPHFPYQLPPEHLVHPDVVADVVSQLGSYTEGFNAAGNVTVRQRRSAFNALVSAMDTEIGRLLQSIDLSNTHVIFLGDNGTQGGTQPPLSQFNVVLPPADESRAKTTLYQGGIKVPMVIAGPGIARPGRRSRSLVNSSDIYATVMQMAGDWRWKQHDSYSLVPDLKWGWGLRWYAFAEQTFPETDGFDPTWFGKEGYTIRDRRYKLIVHPDPGGSEQLELYDLLNDPDENTNLLGGFFPGWHIFTATKLRYFVKYVLRR